MANLTLDLISTNFGIHEHFPISDRLRDVFHGSATVLKTGYEAIENEAPGWGIEIDEAAAKFPSGAEHPSEVRGPDNAVLPGPSV
jgi:mannonate dehydratase